ncbi:hypothetical protein JW921_09105 [Candidatus Fermentibacterales bacterium]|nr:hypothetical protein [Candidatus Fermentibacterales bacterium]
MLSVDSLLSLASSYCARASLGWERLSVFQMTGTARFSGPEVRTRGRFALWGDRAGTRLRGDLYGPDGKPVLSCFADTSGMTAYFPGEETAWFCPGGCPVGEAILTTHDCLCAARTGLPVDPEPWVLMAGALTDTARGSVTWELRPSGRRSGPVPAGDPLRIELKPGELFPGSWSWPGGQALIFLSTPGDEYQSWPGGWRFESQSTVVEIEVVTVNSPADDWPELWSITVPVEIDTLGCVSSWAPSWEIPVR